MSPTDQQLKRIQEKLQQLLKKQAALQKENNQLKEQVQLNSIHKLASEENIETLKQQVAILKVSAGEMSEADKKEFEKKINGYLKEIDRCIDLLGQ